MLNNLVELNLVEASGRLTTQFLVECDLAAWNHSHLTGWEDDNFLFLK